MWFETTEKYHFTFLKNTSINVATFRKNGVGIITPVWFVEDENTLVARTESSYGKMKRIRNYQHVHIAPCDARVRLLGDWVEARAEISSDDAENEKVNRLVTKKLAWSSDYLN